MRFAAMVFLAAAILCAGGGAAEATTLTSAALCPDKALTSWSGQNVSIDWTFTGSGPGANVLIAFQPNAIRFAGALSPMTPAQAAAYAPTLNDLRAAAEAHRKVVFFWDSATKIVSQFTVQWNSPC